jgi:hypothetical protein
MIRTGFTDKQKAEIFVINKATCQFSGKGLWILDYGASPDYDVDWVDHIKPISKGGTSNIENAACVSSIFNYKKRNNTSDNVLFFKKGLPTSDYYYYYTILPFGYCERLKRLRKLHYTDWYFNRVLYRFLVAVDTMLHPKSNKHKLLVRNPEYWLNSALKILLKWQELNKKETVPTFEKRGILPNILSKDQYILLKIREVTKVSSLVSIMKEIKPYYQANEKLIDLLSQKLFKSSDNELKQQLKNAFCSPRIVKIVQTNIDNINKYQLDQSN